MKDEASGRPVFRKPPPEGVVEGVGIGREWSIAGLEEGSLLAARKQRCRLSRDEGESWRICAGELMGWFDERGAPNGRGGVTACDEPGMAETRDGRVLFLARWN